jgi:Cu-Zn family superoxide dismutase
VHKVAALFLVVLAPLFVGAAGEGKPSKPSLKRAVCVVHGLGDHKVSGAIYFTQKGKVVEITGKLTGLRPGKHGFHIHEFGDCTSKDGMSAGGHFDVGNHPHGGPKSSKRHTGDLGNIEANNMGVAEINKRDTVISLSGNRSILGRSLIIHAQEDDLKDIKSAGARIGCGVIGRTKPGVATARTAN